MACLPGLAELAIVSQVAQHAHRALRTFHQRYTHSAQWKQNFWVYGATDDRTKNGDRLMCPGGGICDGSRKPVSALEFFGPRIVGLQIHRDDIYVLVFD